MSNAVENFLNALKRTIKGHPYPALQAQSYQPIRYRVANVSDPLVGSLLSNKYLLAERIGSGSMSIVYKAVQNPIDRVVAIKMMKREWAKDPLTVKRFYLEATAVSKLKHQNILMIHDVGQTDDSIPFFVMELLEGVSLASVVEKYGGLHFLRAVPIFVQVCSAMAHSHKQGLIHRDLKPSNIMLVKNEDNPDYVKLVDFGIVLMTKMSQRASQKLTQKGEIWGSPVYMSPEQCSGGQVDARSDIYSMGMVMYEVLIGKPAFDDKIVARIVQKQLNEMPPAFDVIAPGKSIPKGIEEIVFKCIQKNPADRYRTMEELEKDLRSQMPRNPRKNTTSQWMKFGGANNANAASKTVAGANPGGSTPTGSGQTAAAQFGQANPDVGFGTPAEKAKSEELPLPNSGPDYASSAWQNTDASSLEAAGDAGEEIDKTVRTRFSKGNKNSMRDTHDYTRKVSKDAPAANSNSPSTTAIKALVIGSALLILLVIGGAAIGIMSILPAIKQTLKNPKADLQGVLQGNPADNNPIQTVPSQPNNKTNEVPVLNGPDENERIEDVNEAKEDALEDASEKLDSKNEAEDESKSGNNPGATDDDVKSAPESSAQPISQPEELRAEAQKISSPSAPTKQLRKQRSSNSNGTDRSSSTRSTRRTDDQVDDELLERIHVRKHRGDNLQQWMDVKESEQ